MFEGCQPHCNRSCFFSAANSLSEVLRNSLLGKRLVQKAPIWGSKKWTLEWEPLLGFHLNSYCKPETAPILGSLFGTQKWEPLFGSISSFERNYCGIQNVLKANPRQRNNRTFAMRRHPSNMLNAYCGGPSPVPQRMSFLCPQNAGPAWVGWFSH